MVAAVSDRWEISWWAYTGDYGPERDGVSSPILVNLKTDETLESWELPFGACYDANPGLGGGRRYPSGDDGCAIVCVVPRTTPADPAKKGHWFIDGRASNCTLPNDAEHRCWVRHGTVGEALHVDKNGKTCAAGAGSIQYAAWHGFLHHGVLKP